MSQKQVHLKKENVLTLKMHLKCLQVICRKVKMAVTWLVQTSDQIPTLQQNHELDEQHEHPERINANQVKSCLTRHKFQAAPSWLLACLIDSFLSSAQVSISLEQWCCTVMHPIQIHTEIMT